MTISGYSKIYNLGHKVLADLLKDPVIIEEKLDGSQFSFTLTEEGELLARSKGKQIDWSHPDKMFINALTTVKSLKDKLTPGYVYRGEYFQRPKHNTLAYDRIPEKHIMIFDIDTNDGQNYLNEEQKYAEATRLGLEVVPYFYKGMITDLPQLENMLGRLSVLGGAKIEGIVIKNYNRFDPSGKVLMGKHVSEEFKEMHDSNRKTRNPGKNDLYQVLGQKYCTEARWRKAVQHLRERGELTDSPQDIGNLLKELNVDLEQECADEIKEELFKHAWPTICKGAKRGFPKWYKEQLLAKQFESTENNVTPNQQV